MFIAFARAEKLGTLLSALAILALVLFVWRVSPARASEPALAAATVPVRLFGSSENVNLDIAPFPKWTGLLRRYARERRLEDGPCTGNCAVQEWHAFVASLRGRDRMRQLEAVNAYANRIPYRSDMDRYGVLDHWATPLESLGRSADCEDYAIVKYLSLRKLGWPAGALRIVVLKHELRNELHAVLVAYVDGTAYVLDNLGPDVREHAAIRHYRPIFSINEVAWHYHRDWNPASAVMVARAWPDRPQADRPQADRAQADRPQADRAQADRPQADRALPGRGQGGQLRPAPTQIAAAAPAVVTARPLRDARAYAYAAPPVRLAARSYAGNAGESLAALFSNAGGVR